MTKSMFAGFSARALILAGLCAGALAALTVASQAREHGIRVPGHHGDFYAYAGGADPVERAAAPATSHGGCFTTNTPAEAAKGIRHWSGGC